MARLKVKQRPAMVTLSVQAANPAQRVSISAAPEDLYALRHDPEVVLVDAVHSYAVATGRFGGELDPGRAQLSTFPHVVESALKPSGTRGIAMSRTGGMLCQRATLLLCVREFARVFHRKRGILNSLEERPLVESRWHRTCLLSGGSKGVSSVLFSASRKLEADRGGRTLPDLQIERVSSHLRIMEHVT